MHETDRRFAERFDMQLPALLTPPSELGCDGCRLLLTRDISSLGAYFHTMSSKVYDGPIRIEMFVRISNGNERERYVLVNTTGVVKRREAKGLAVEFDENYTLKPFD